MTSHRAQPDAASLDAAVDAVLSSSRALVAVSARSIAEAAAVTLPQFRMLVVLSAAPSNLSALAGALDDLSGSRRGALWQAADATSVKQGQLDINVPYQPPLLPELTLGELLIHDLQATGISPEDHPMQHSRAAMRERGVLRTRDLLTVESGRRIEVAGVVTHRQRPATASGITFLNLEDETGLVNVICSRGVWHRYRVVARAAPAMIIRGILERSPENIVNIVADRIEKLPITVELASRDFR